MKKLILLFCITALLISCSKDEDNDNKALGDSYQGGKIAYILQSGDPGYDPNVQHGLIAASGDQSMGVIWYNGTFTSTGATGTALGTGSSNTDAIVANQGAGSYAAKLCADLVLDGYSDWYLPSREELIKVQLNKSVWRSSYCCGCILLDFFRSGGTYTS